MSTHHLNTFLFAWNPVKYEWPEIAKQIEALHRGERVKEHWSCATKKIKPGDRAFVSIVGIEPKGIFASGRVVSELFIGENHRGKMANRVMIEFDVLLDPSKEPILTLDILNIGPLEKQVWTPQASGISIKPELVEELEALWQDFLKTRSKA
jgi:5-methylcytosine-specific restriction protein A